MIKLHIPLWELVAAAAALYVLAVFMIRGQLLKSRLRGELMGKKRFPERAVSPVTA